MSDIRTSRGEVIAAFSKIVSERRTLLFIFAIVIGSIIIQAPLYDRALTYNDEGYILNTSEEISNGDVLYLDKPGYVFPGLLYSMGLLYKVFGVSLILSRIVMAVGFSAMCIMVFLISRRLMAEWIAFFTALLFVLLKAWAFPIWNMIGYATFSILLLSISAYFLVEYCSTSRISFVFLCGFFAAVGGLFKQDYGGVVALGFFFLLLILPVLKKNSEDEARSAPAQVKVLSLYVAGGLIVLLPVLAYFAAVGAFPDMFLNTFWIPLTAETKRNTTQLIPLFPLFSQDRFLREHLFEYVPAPHLELVLDRLYGHRSMTYLFTYTPVWDFLTKLVHYSPYAVLILSVGIIVMRFRRSGFETRYGNANVIIAYSISVLLTQHPPYDFLHLMQMYAPTLILLGFLVDAAYRRLEEKTIMRRAFSVFLAVVVILFVYETIWATRFISGRYSTKLSGPRANVYLKAKNEAVWRDALDYITSVTSSDEPIFVMPYHSMFYFLSERKNPTRYDILWEIKTYATRDEEILCALDTKNVQYIVYSPTQPADWGSIEQFAPELMREIRARYSVVKVFGDPNADLSFIIMKRKESGIGPSFGIIQE